ncbi:MAG: M23 family metallopeptidase [Chthoniobacterales bacterium]
MRRTLLWFMALLTGGALIAADPQTAHTRMADGFDVPVGKPDGEGYFIQRGFRPNGHLGEDWNGNRGGNTDLGDPVFAVGHGMVVFSRDAHMGWGNVVIIRHAYVDGGEVKTVDSLYAHMDRIMVREGQQILRGQQVGTIGTNHGMYPAHLHFEMRKNIYIGVNHSSFKRDFSNYFSPSQFIGQHRHLSGAGRSALIAINTFDTQHYGQPSSESRGNTMTARRDTGETKGASASRHPFHVDRFGGFQSF